MSEKTASHDAPQGKPQPGGHAAQASRSGTNAPTQMALSADGSRKEYRIRGATFSVTNKYDVIKCIGVGAYGMVCSAKDTETGQNVAIKKVSRLFVDLVDTRRMLREVRIMRYLQGSEANVAQLVEVMPSGEAKQSFRDIYIVTELFDTDLHALLRTNTKLSFSQHAFLGFQLFKALAFLHNAGVMHRDLKPANVFIAPPCRLAIGDFGLARGGLTPAAHDNAASDANAFNQETLTDYVVTRSYRPPELLLMGDYTYAVDLWSCGCILAEMMLRRPIFHASNYMQHIQLIAEFADFPTDPEELRKALPGAGPQQLQLVEKVVGKINNADKSAPNEAEVEAGVTRPERTMFRMLGLTYAECSKTWRRFVSLTCALLRVVASTRPSAYDVVKHPYFAHLLEADGQKAHYETAESYRAFVQSSLKVPEAKREELFAFESAPLTEALLRDGFCAEMSQPKHKPRPESLESSTQSVEVPKE